MTMNHECAQAGTESYEASVRTNYSSIDYFRYHADESAVSGRHLVAKLSLYKDKSMLAKLGFPLNNFTHREDLSHFVFATAADRDHFHSAMDAIASMQAVFPDNLIYFFDLSGNELHNDIPKYAIPRVSVEPQSNTYTVSRKRPPFS